MDQVHILQWGGGATIRHIDLDSFQKEEIYGHTSKGNQPKWHVDNVWYKADHMGYETLAEVVISRLLRKSNISEHVDYSPVLIRYNGKEYIGCESISFQQKNEILIPLERLHRAYYGIGLAEKLGKISEVEKRILYTADFISEITGLADVGKYLTMLIELDAFFLNEDRHTNNIALIRNEKTKEFRLCPIFDNGLSLLSDTNDYTLDEDVYGMIGRVKAKPFSMNFDEQLDAAINLFGGQLCFSFHKQDVQDALKEFEEYYSRDILERTERVLFEQMRKYSYMFS